jgi:hypothetical protein
MIGDDDDDDDENTPKAIYYIFHQSIEDVYSPEKKRNTNKSIFYII